MTFLKPHLVFLIFTYACSGSYNQNEHENEVTQNHAEAIHTQVKKKTDVFIIPSPVELAAFLEKSKLTISENLFFNTNNKENLIDNFQKALGIGMYGADLGFINFYGKYNLMPEYFHTVTKLSEDLRLGQVFNYEKIKKMIDEKDNLDSILFITTRNFEILINNLESSNRNDIKSLIIMGGWIESMYITTQVLDVNQLDMYIKNHPLLLKRIGTQKNVLLYLTSDLESQNKNGRFSQLTNSLKELSLIYENIKMTYNPSKPEILESEDAITIIDKSSSEVDIQPQVLKELIQKIGEIRMQLI